jgi:predicted nucleotidyltransferase
MLNLTPRHKESLDYALRELSRRDFIEEIWLFGNCTAKPRYESDVDLWVLVNPTTNPKTMRQTKSELFCQPELDIKFSVKPFYEKNDAFSQMLKREAVKLWPEP